MLYWTITPEWKGETAFIIAGGPSVLQQDLTRLAGRRVVVVNSSYESYPAADILFFGDRRWYFDHYKRPEFVAFKGQKVTCCAADTPRPIPGVLRLKRSTPVRDSKTGIYGPGFAHDPSTVVSNRTNLQGAMNMAAHLGVARMVLLGADMCRGEGGRSHHHAPHKWTNKPGNGTWDIQIPQLRLIAEPLQQLGIEVINTSPISRIDWWPKLNLEDAVCG